MKNNGKSDLQKQRLKYQRHGFQIPRNLQSERKPLKHIDNSEVIKNQKYFNGPKR